MKQTTIDFIKRQTKIGPMNPDAETAKPISPKPKGARQLKTFREFIKERDLNT
jgi:hypothetical protein